MSSLQVGRLQIGPAWTWHEAVGDPVTNLGGAVIPAPRQSLRHMVEIGTISPDGDSDTITDRLRIRRQLRSMLNNTPLKLQGYLYVIYSDDSEQNGWYVPDFGSLADLEGSSGLATGVWKLEQVAWLMMGHRRANREARNIWMKDLRTGLAWRDQLKYIYSLAFSGVGGVTMPALQINYLPTGATSVSLSANGSAVPLLGGPPQTGRDGGICPIVTGLSDLDCISFERPEANMGQGDVIVYDRRGGQTGPFYSANVIDDNPISYWRLDETSGTAAVDQIGNNPGVYTGSHTKNQAGALTGGSDNDASVLLTGGWVDVGKGLNIDMSAISVECWIKPTSIGAVNNIVSNLTNPVGFQLKQATNGTISFIIGPATQVNTTMTPSSGSWHHVVGTWDGAIQRLYIDGLLQASLAYTGPMGVSPLSLQIGASNSGSTFPGNIDEVAIYQYALQPKQIADHYASGASYDGGNQWEEALGPDYSWGWVDAGASEDTPVLSNGLCRIRYDPVTVKGFRIDVWQSNGAVNGAAGWVEQGKIRFRRLPAGSNFNTFVSGSLIEWTPDRAVMLLVMRASADAYSRERIYVTMDRGVTGCTIECYPSQTSAGNPTDMAFWYSPALNANVGDLNNSVVKIDSQGVGNWAPGGVGSAVIAATAGSGIGTGQSGQFGVSLVTLGNSDFATSENWVSLLRCPTVIDGISAYQTNFAFIQDTSLMFRYGGSDTTAYGFADNNYDMETTGTFGYIQAQISYALTRPQQIMEAETMTIASGTSIAGDGTASGGSMTTTARTTDAIHVSKTTWPDNVAISGKGTFRVFARVKSTATTSSSFYAKTGATVGTTVVVPTLATPVWVWIDLGEISATSTTLEIHAWRTGAAGAAQVDRIEAVLVKDQSRSTFVYSGARDAGQAALYDARQLGAVVART